ncbi:MAG: matrixin family metalloprotease, partial [Pirellulales bacterium]|nr:matrixin family metalloprotease [Pirellulales bacterium]
MRQNRTLICERLEVRQVLAGFGTAWPNPRSLTVSFPTDQAQIGAYNNALRYVFDQVTDRLQWQEAALRAFQTWAVETNLNLGLVVDRGDHFGTVGLSQGDPRFGDFRIGAFPQQGVLANALPYQVLAGTWSGDVLLNTQVNYFLADWQSDSTIDVPDPNEKGPAVELFSVLLHEAGNALGLEDVDLPGAVMHLHYQGPQGELAQTDISAIRQLYGGPRQDIYEPLDNGTLASATFIPAPSGFAGEVSLTVPGSLNDHDDVDHYRFEPLAGQENVVVRLRASGISLLKSHLFVTDAAG